MNKEFNVLIIEEDDNTFSLLKDILEKGIYKIWRVTTGKEALNMIKNFYCPLIITELQISDMSGIEFVKRVKRTSGSINIVAITSYSFLNLGVKALQQGAFWYLLKPLNVDEAKLIIKRAIENACLLIQAGKGNYYKEMSLIDGLTGVYNHRYFYEMLDWHIAHMRRYPQTFSMLMVDIDNFKKFNDTKGHQEGDRILRGTADALVSLLRDDDLVFRYGGEEFTVILPRTEQNNAIKVAQRVVNLVKKKLPITISTGVSTFLDSSDTRVGIVKCADKALYRAKKEGKDRFCVYNEKDDN